MRCAILEDFTKIQEQADCIVATLALPNAVEKIVALYRVARPRDPSNPIRISIPFNRAYGIFTIVDTSQKTMLYFRCVDLVRVL